MTAQPEQPIASIGALLHRIDRHLSGDVFVSEDRVVRRSPTGSCTVRGGLRYTGSKTPFLSTRPCTLYRAADQALKRYGRLRTLLH